MDMSLQTEAPMSCPNQPTASCRAPGFADGGTPVPAVQTNPAVSPDTPPLTQVLRQIQVAIFLQLFKTLITPSVPSADGLFQATSMSQPPLTCPVPSAPTQRPGPVGSRLEACAPRLGLRLPVCLLGGVCRVHRPLPQRPCFYGPISMAISQVPSPPLSALRHAAVCPEAALTARFSRAPCPLVPVVGGVGDGGARSSRRVGSCLSSFSVRVARLVPPCGHGPWARRPAFQSP